VGNNANCQVGTLSPCSCPRLETLQTSFQSAERVFLGRVIVVTPDDMMVQVLVSEVFKGTGLAVNDLVYITYSCGSFPASINNREESVFFTHYIGGSYPEVISCAPNGVPTADTLTRLRQGLSSNCHVAGKTYRDGDMWGQDCNTCFCVQGLPVCSKETCNQCKTSSGVVVPEGSRVREDCNYCQCTGGRLSCTQLACDVGTGSGGKTCMDMFGGVRQDNAIWTVAGADGTCSKWKCLNGQGVELSEGGDCSPAPPSSQITSKFFVIGISMGAALLIVVIATIISIIRRRMRAQELEDGDELDDADSVESLSDDIPFMNNNGGGEFAVNSTPYAPAYSQPQQTAYPTYVPGWGGQQVATTPMVLMTQTGEPVVVQVAYM